MRRLLAALFLGFVAVAAPALAETTLEKISGTGVLTIGTRRGSPPFGFVNKTNEWVGFSRSEERRVGKECRAGWSAYHQKKKTKNEVAKSRRLTSTSACSTTDQKDT